MYMYTQGHSRLISVGAHIPEDKVTSHDLLQAIDTENRFGLSNNWLERATGIKERRAAPTDMLPSDMATRAAQEALESAGLSPSDIDVVIFAGMDRDYLVEPATAHVVQDKIGARNAITFDVSNACHGFMNGIHLVDALIATGQVRRGLVVAGEMGSKHARKAMKALQQVTDRDTFIKLAVGLTLGDAGAAIILGPKLEPETGFMGFMLQSRGQYSTLCNCGKRGEESPLEADMPAIIDEGIAMLGGMYGVFMQRLGWQPEEIAKFLHHQVGLRIFKRHATYAKIATSIMPDTVSTKGNLITANIPLGLYNIMNSKEIKNGEKVFISGAGSGLSISQAGLIWDAA